MKEFFSNWLEDQIIDGEDYWEFPEDFDKDGAVEFLLKTFDYDIIYQHLHERLNNYFFK